MTTSRRALTHGWWVLIVALMTTPAAHVFAHTAPQTAAPAPAETAETAERNLRAYTELLRADLRVQKVAILTELLSLTDAEDKAFWPIYREYEAALAGINDERLALIDEYAREYATLTDALADKLARQALALEARRTALKQQYYDRFKTALSARTAARFLQIEHQIQLLLDLQIAAALPVVSNVPPR